MLGCSWLRYTQHLGSPRKGARTVRLQESSQMGKMAHYDAPHSLGAPTILIMAAPDFWSRLILLTGCDSTTPALGEQ